MAEKSVKIIDHLADVIKAINKAVDTRVMVGVPSAKAGRRSGPITNAALAYIHEHGDSLGRIPARPFMAPGIAEVEKEIEEGLRTVAELALEGKPEGVTKQQHRVGMVARDSIKRKIASNIPPPLALSTVQGRIRRRQSRTYRAQRSAQVKANIAAGAAPGEGLFTTLVDTGQLRNAISYVLRKEGDKVT